MNEIDEYITSFPSEVQEKLEQIRSLVKALAPEAKEVMKYGIPTFTLGKNLVHYAGYKNHIGFYPAPSGIKKFSVELSDFKLSKGAIQFPHDRELPMDIIEKIIVFRIKENKAQL
jgi:uncharacterized protein YdhG (YjbR/CyaY superfamily)